MTSQNLTRRQIWLLAARPKTLPAAAAPVIVGTALAWRDGVFNLGAALAALFGALCIQIGTNLANDYFDFLKGADTAERLGPVRVTQAGLLQPAEVARGMWLAFGLATLAGAYLFAAAGWAVVLIGLLSIAAGIAYTGGPFPLGYHGLGDFAVFVFFGLVAVGGTYYVQGGRLTPEVLLASTPIGFLATAILVVNNLRDIGTDAKAGKRTLAVRLGETKTRIEYDLLCSAAFAIPLLMWLLRLASPWALLAWLSGWRLVPLLRTIYTERGRALNAALAGTGWLELEFAILFAVGLNL
jgi:1,4-dihydroxy-2-naphthoate octaprenyltransferase